MIIATFEQYTDSWYEIRKGRITGSRFDQMMMGEKSQGYNNLIGELAAEIITGEIEDSYKSEIMQNGTDTEPEAREHLSDIVGNIIEVGFLMPAENSPYHEWCGFSPDGIIESSGHHIEIKCPLLKTHLRYFKEMAAEEYRWQLQGGLWINKNPKAIFSSYYPGVKQLVLEIEPIEKDQNAIEDRMKLTVERVQELIETYRKYEVLR